MAWRFPKEMPQTGAAVDPDEVTAAMQPFIEELSGGLDEHNFKSGAFTRANMADDVAMALFHMVQADDASGTTSTADTGVVQMVKSWSPILSDNGDYYEDTVTTDECILWIMASFQTRQAWPGVCWGIAVDGVVVLESVQGGTEYSSETVLAPITGETYSPGVCNPHHAVTLEALVPVPAGTHTVEVRGLPIQADKSIATQEYEVYARELITIELVNA